ncbi:MAG: hypothetical protein CVU56_04170 [Deltaproteobacteria bacterium HGW-Deltaproteobacteria-14]|nr:MAG: hypothetical protein CVU56_04170 [Deltaproteobacteria bacterium HGW-Deltaproteobacteria-14]
MSPPSTAFGSSCAPAPSAPAPPPPASAPPPPPPPPLGAGFSASCRCFSLTVGAVVAVTPSSAAVVCVPTIPSTPSALPPGSFFACFWKPFTAVRVGPRSEPLTSTPPHGTENVPATPLSALCTQRSKDEVSSPPT